MLNFRYVERMKINYLLLSSDCDLEFFFLHDSSDWSHFFVVLCLQHFADFVKQGQQNCQCR